MEKLWLMLKHRVAGLSGTISERNQNSGQRTAIMKPHVSGKGAVPGGAGRRPSTDWW